MSSRGLKLVALAKEKRKQQLAKSTDTPPIFEQSQDSNIEQRQNLLVNAEATVADLFASMTAGTIESTDDEDSNSLITTLEKSPSGEGRLGHEVFEDSVNVNSEGAIFSSISAEVNSLNSNGVHDSSSENGTEQSSGDEWEPDSYQQDLDDELSANHANEVQSGVTIDTQLETDSRQVNIPVAVEPVPDRNDDPLPSTSGHPLRTTTATTVVDSENRIKRRRKRKADPACWEKNKDIKKRKIGEGYTGRKKLNGKTIKIQKEPRKMGPTCTSQNCIKSSARKCNEFTEDDRAQIFSNFWKNMDWPQKKVYVSTLVDKFPVKRRRGRNNDPKYRRNSTLQYHLKKNDVKFQVCRKMFLHTLGLNEWSVQHWTSKSSDGTHKSPTIHPPLRPKQKGAQREFLKKFLQDLPKMPSHYCRARTSKMYLEPIFQSKNEVYRVYSDKCLKEGVQKLGVTSFAEEFDALNIGLFQPKKDLCDTCIMYEAGNITEEAWNVHQTKKESARKEMNNDTEKAKVSEGKTKVITMDVEAVLLSPKLNASALYYKTKLLIHNFTIFDNATHDVKCYLWHEGEGGITADEFASCIIHYLSVTVTAQCEEVVLWSDGCGYQNRNSYLSNALVQFAVQKNIVITQKILEKGHTQMVCDSVHSMVERKVKKANINVPADYVNIIASARENPTPYSVEYLDHSFFKKYSSLQAYSSIRPGTKKGDPTVCDLRALRYNTDGTIQYKLELNEDWKVLPRRLVNLSLQAPQALFKSRLKIKLSKWKHLQELKEVLKKDYHSFYDNLLHD